MLTMTEDQQNQLQTPGLEEVKEKTARLKGKESESFSFYIEQTLLTPNENLKKVPSFVDQSRLLLI